jgi:hypothetical protein
MKFKRADRIALNLVWLLVIRIAFSAVTFLPRMRLVASADVEMRMLISAKMLAQRFFIGLHCDECGRC